MRFSLVSYLDPQSRSTVRSVQKELGALTGALAFKDLSKEGFENGIIFLENNPISLQTRIDHIALVEMLPESTYEFIRFNFGN